MISDDENKRQFTHHWIRLSVQTNSVRPPGAELYREGVIQIDDEK